MNVNAKITCLFVILVVHSFWLYAEGTRQIMPTTDVQGSVEINKMRSDFGFFDGSPEYRINIAITSTQERIRFGFGEVFGSGWFSYPGDMVFRIKDPTGNIIYGPAQIPVNGQTGYINSYNKALIGPFPGGYSYIEMIPNTTGDFFIEFYYPPDATGYTDENQHSFRYFDMTVIDAVGNPVDGRLWSKAWQFWCMDAEFPPSTHRFYGTLMILSDDSIVTQVSANGFIGGAFAISSNITGCMNTGNAITDRQSRQGSHTYPQYKIFLNDPDSILFPTSKVNPGILLPVTVTTDCNTGGADIGVKVVKDGTVEILIELNPLPGADPEDVKIMAKVKANPGVTGYNQIFWDGKDNFGNPVPNGTVLLATVKFLTGFTHMPLDDIEFNDNGFAVSQVRPAGSQMKIFWDDSRISGGTVDTIDGCLTGTGCHTWDNTVGDKNTINSWWYVKRDQIPSVPFTLKRLPGTAGQITGKATLCRDSITLDYWINRIRDTETYVWSYSGTGVVISAGDTLVSLTFSRNSTSGTLSVLGHNSLCGDGSASILNIIVDSLPSVMLTMTPEICQTVPAIHLVGGTPVGGEYSVDGIITDTFDPGKDSLGPHLIVYTYTTLGGCLNSDSALVVVKICLEIPVFFPDAFTPDGDGLNDFFRPVGTTFITFRLNVFNRFGQMILSTDNPSEGWDGTFNGEPCPTGVYPWISIFEVPEQNHIKKTVKGTVTLVR